MTNIQQQIAKTTAHLVTDASNIAYLTNFTGSNGTVFLTQKKTFLITDARYTRVAQKVVSKGVEVIISSKLTEELSKLVSKLKIRAIYFDAHEVSVYRHKLLQKTLKSLKPSTNFIEQFRIIKSKQELSHIIKSQRINEQVFKKVIQSLRAGKTEKQVACEIEKTGRELGADGISFEPIIGFGANSGSPHHMNTTKKLKKGDIVLIDMGMTYKGYCSDMTRTLFTQKPTNLQTTIYNTVLNAQVSAEKALKANIKGSTADKIARDIITKAGYGPLFGHSLGHGIGLQVHEAPNLSTGYHKPLPEGTVVTVEPGIYLQKSFGVRIEDMVIIKRNKAENITKIPKKIEESIISIS